MLAELVECGACESVELVEPAMPADLVDHMELARGTCEACRIDTLFFNILSLCLSLAPM